MVCIAAFIILILVGAVVAFLSIFKKDLGKKYLKLLKKAWHCFGKRVRLQKCDTNFSEDVKTALLKKVIIKKPKLVKPLSVTLEIASFLIVIVTAWSLIEAAKAGLSLWVFGTCNVSQPSNCALGADVCSIDEDNLNWFTEWGEIFSNIPDRLKTWDASSYDLTATFETGTGEKQALALVDPGCSVCMQSYKNLQQDQKFLETHTVKVILYPIKNTDGSYRFKNSALIARYTLAAPDYAEKIIARIFTEYDENHINYQEVFNNRLSSEEAENLLKSWLEEWGASAETVKEIAEKSTSEEISQTLEKNIKTIDSEIKPKGIPTMIYDGKRHLGLYK